jgi:hypothetical protein
MGDFGKVMEGFQRIQILPVLLVVYIDWPLCQVKTATGLFSKKNIFSAPSRRCNYFGFKKPFDECVKSFAGHDPKRKSILTLVLIWHQFLGKNVRFKI